MTREEFDRNENLATDSTRPSSEVTDKHVEQPTVLDRQQLFNTPRFFFDPTAGFEMFLPAVFMIHIYDQRDNIMIFVTFINTAV